MAEDAVDVGFEATLKLGASVSSLAEELRRDREERLAAANRHERHTTIIGSSTVNAGGSAFIKLDSPELGESWDVHSLAVSAPVWSTAVTGSALAATGPVQLGEPAAMMIRAEFPSLPAIQLYSRGQFTITGAWDLWVSVTGAPAGFSLLAVAHVSARWR